MIDTPISSVLGGALIGASASVLLLANGRIAGISGIVGHLVGPGTNDKAWRLAFVVGLVSGAVLLHGIAPSTIQAPEVGVPLGAVALAGVLVGVGTQLGGGCTSGHGVCGISRFAPRSYVATATFMATGMLATFFAHHVLALGAP